MKNKPLGVNPGIRATCAMDFNGLIEDLRKNAFHLFLDGLPLLLGLPSLKARAIKGKNAFKAHAKTR